jgi:cytochrome c oxidase subunit 4
MAEATAHAEQHEHPSPATYLKIAVILTVITAIEVSIYYIPAMRGVLVPLLLVFSAIKFLTVVGWYMHLKFDATLYARLFFGPLVIALLVTVVLMFLFGHFIAHATP